MVTYDQVKRAKHAIDLTECESVIDFALITVENKREAYGELRLKSLGWWNNRVVVLIWTDRSTGPYLISCRYGDKHETNRYFDEST